MQAPSPGLSDHTSSLKKNSASAWSQELAALDRTLQPGTNLQTGKLRNIALKHAVPPQTAAVSLQGPATLLRVGLETLICCLQEEGEACPCWRQEGNLIAQLRRKGWVGSWGSAPSGSLSAEVQSAVG